jgi:phosphohistidine phosphatase
MRELILLRHAHAEAAPGDQADIERPLSLTGQAEADAAGRWLKENDLLPERVVCSPSQRTRETAERAMAALGYVDVRYDDRIYEATPGALMEVADGHRELGRVMLVGHNPGFEQLVALLATGQSGDFRGIPPAGIAVLRLPASTALEPGIAQLAAFWWP